MKHPDRNRALVPILFVLAAAWLALPLLRGAALQPLEPAETGGARADDVFALDTRHHLRTPASEPRFEPLADPPPAAQAATEITFTVVNEAGKRLADAPARFVQDARREVLVGDTRGRFRACPQPGRPLVVEIGGDEYGAKKIELAALPAGTSTELGEITLSRGHPTTGRVVDTHGEPVAGAQVRMGPFETPSSLYKPSRGRTSNALLVAVSGPDGTFELGAAPAGTWRIAARTAEGWYSLDRILALRLGEASHVELRLERYSDTPPAVEPLAEEPGPGARGATVIVEVVTPAGRALSGIVVALVGPAGVSRWATTDCAGRIALRHVSDGPYIAVVHAWAPRPYGPEPVARLALTLTAGETRVERLVVHAPILRVRVVSGGGPVAGVLVGLARPSELAQRSLSLRGCVRTAQDGTALVVAPGAGDYFVFARTGLSEPLSAEPIRLETGANETELALASGAVRGRVEDAAGHGRSGVRAELVREDFAGRPIMSITWSDGAARIEAHLAVTCTDDSGRFAFEHVPAGAWRLRLVDSGGVQREESVFVHAGEAVVLERARLVTGTRLELDLEAPEGAALEDLRGSLLELIDARGERSALAVLADLSGVTFEAVAPGTHAVWLHRAGLHVQVATVEVPTRGVLRQRVTLAPSRGADDETLRRLDERRR